jgi:hypothetical protein
MWTREEVLRSADRLDREGRPVMAMLLRQDAAGYQLEKPEGEEKEALGANP